MERPEVDIPSYPSSLIPARSTLYGVVKSQNKVSSEAEAADD